VGAFLISLLVVVALALMMRFLRTPGPAAPPPPPPPLQGGPPDDSWRGRPCPGDIWLTTDDERVLVVRTYPETVDVLPMPGERPETTARLLPDAAFARRVGQAEQPLWDEIQKSHRTGFAV
jgi:hypothetical protein